MEAGRPKVTVEFEYTTEAQRIALEQAIAFVTQMQQLADAAPDGTVLAACEELALTDGRKLLRDTLACAVQTRVNRTDAQKKSTPAPRGNAPAGS